LGCKKWRLTREMGHVVSMGEQRNLHSFGGETGQTENNGKAQAEMEG